MGDSLPYRRLLVGRAFLLRWTDEPTLASVDAIHRDVTAAAMRAGERVLYLGVVPPTIPFPNATVRRAFTGRLEAMSLLAERMDIVIEGTDFRIALVRTLLRTMSTLARTSNMSAFATVEEALSLWRRQGTETDTILRRWQTFDPSWTSAA